MITEREARHVAATRPNLFAGAVVAASRLQDFQTGSGLTAEWAAGVGADENDDAAIADALAGLMVQTKAAEEAVFRYGWRHARDVLQVQLEECAADERTLWA